MKYVYFYFHKYLHGLKKVSNAHRSHGRPKKMVVDQVYVLSMSPLGHHITFSPKETKLKSKMVSKLNSDSEQRQCNL
jgi:hypothetical protein